MREGSASSSAGPAALDRLLVILSVAGYVLVLVTLVTGGFSFQAAGLRVSSHNLFRPFAVATLSMAIAVAISSRRAAQLADFWQKLERHAAWIAVCAAIFTLVAGVRYGTFTAGGSDSYGYVS